MSYKCSNCPWEGDKLSKQSEGALLEGKCPECGDEVKGKGKNKKEVNMDLNNDGVVDKKDASIAGKVLGRVRKRKSKK